MSAIPLYIQKINAQLGIPADEASKRNLPFIPEWTGPVTRLDLETVTRASSLQILAPKASNAWHSMAAAARRDKIILLCVSSFRTVGRQKELIENLLLRKKTIQEILTLVAPPGYSHHHSAYCVDISCPSAEKNLKLKFGETKAFRWLTENAALFGFYNTVGPNNPWGYINEPWHWHCEPTKEIAAGISDL